jgi:hypothetical protein
MRRKTTLRIKFGNPDSITDLMTFISVVRLRQLRGHRFKMKKGTLWEDNVCHFYIEGCTNHGLYLIISEMSQCYEKKNYLKN